MNNDGGDAVIQSDLDCLVSQAKSNKAHYNAAKYQVTHLETKHARPTKQETASWTAVTPGRIEGPERTSNSIWAPRKMPCWCKEKNVPLPTALGGIWEYYAKCWLT